MNVIHSVILNQIFIRLPECLYLAFMSSEKDSINQAEARLGEVLVSKDFFFYKTWKKTGLERKLCLNVIMSCEEDAMCLNMKHDLNQNLADRNDSFDI